MMTDPIADMLTRVRNAVAAGHSNVVMPASHLKADIARVLREEGYIRGFDVQEDKGKRTLRIQLRYAAKKQPILVGLKRISRKSLWDADHILAVAEGGGECDLDNLRTLCLLCHRRQTVELRRRLASAATSSA